MHPRIMIAGTGGDCGKTTVSLGLAAAWLRQGLDVAPFKKGPDYIDAAWLSIAAGRPTRNLDTWMMGAAAVSASFRANALSRGINLIEGNRGLHDGEDAQGTHSSAELAKLLASPVLLVLPAHKITRTAAAVALGMKLLDPALDLVGIILNRVATARQESVMRTSIESATGLPVLGAIPKTDENLLPGRHMGLITPQEHTTAERAVHAAADLIGRSVDLARVRKIAEAAARYPDTGPAICGNRSTSDDEFSGLHIGYFKSTAFTFYYPENLEAIDRAGATRVAVDPLKDSELPPMDALYIGGGFPETHAARLADNASFRRSVAQSAANGLPIWAECGGLMFLAQSIFWKDSRYPMASYLPIEISIGEKPAGHGYEEVIIDRPNPFIPTGTSLRGHEFHYSQVLGGDTVETAFEVRRGVGLGRGRDGIVQNRVLASYLHIHNLASPEWAHWLLQAASEYKTQKATQETKPRNTPTTRKKL
jgi:cobyrinic acid a,c-diamide synthase